MGNFIFKMPHFKFFIYLYPKHITMLLDFLFPNRCLQCNQIISGEELVCEICFSQIHFTHFKFNENHLFKERCRLLFPTENAFALMYFEKGSLSQKMIHSLKYGNREKTGKILAEWTSDRIDFGNEKPDVLVSIPLHPKKLKKRGYNQLHLFTETLSEKFDIPFDHEVLKRNIHTKAQAKKNREQRLQATGKFSLNKKISGKHVLMIDDVFTTGSTMADAVWQILKNDNKISVLVMAMD